MRNSLCKSLIVQIPDCMWFADMNSSFEFVRRLNVKIINHIELIGGSSNVVAISMIFINLLSLLGCLYLKVMSYIWNTNL